MRCWPRILSFSCLILAALQAVAVQASLQISPTSVDVGLGVAALTLPNTNACCVGATIHLTNTGNAVVNFSSFSFTSPDFVINTGHTLPHFPPTSLSPGASGDVDVAFGPQSAGRITTMLVIADDAPGSPHQVTLTGTGIGSNDFGIAQNQFAEGPQTVTAGQAVRYALYIAAGNGFTGGITLSCNTLPPGAVCEGPPQPIQTTGPVFSNFFLNVATTAATARHGLHPGWWWASFFAVAGLLVAGRRSRRYRGFLLAIMLFLACTAIVSCGSGGGGGGSGHTPTPPGTYNFTLTSSSGSTTHNTQLTLIVK